MTENAYQLFAQRIKEKLVFILWRQPWQPMFRGGMTV